MRKVSTQWMHSLELFQVNVLVKFEGECDIVFVSKVGVGVRRGCGGGGSHKCNCIELRLVKLCEVELLIL